MTVKGPKNFHRSLKALQAKAHITLWISLAILFTTPMIALGAQGGWRTQQGPEKELYVETPPIPGVPYGKSPQEEVNLPPEIKEIDEKIKKDAQQLIAPLRSATQGSQESQAGSGDTGRGQLPQQAGSQVPGIGPAQTPGTGPASGVGAGAGSQVQTPALSSEPAKAAQTQGTAGTSETKVFTDQKTGSEPTKGLKDTDKANLNVRTSQRDQMKETKGVETAESNLQPGEKGKSSGFMIKGLIAVILIGLSAVALKVFFKRS